MVFVDNAEYVEFRVYIGSSKSSPREANAVAIRIPLEIHRKVQDEQNYLKIWYAAHRAQIDEGVKFGKEHYR